MNDDAAERVVIGPDREGWIALGRRISASSERDEHDDGHDASVALGGRKKLSAVDSQLGTERRTKDGSVGYQSGPAAWLGRTERDRDSLARRDSCEH